MIIEVFVKGTNFKEHDVTYYNIKSILMDSGRFVLVHSREDCTNAVINAEEFELKVSY